MSDWEIQNMLTAAEARIDELEQQLAEARNAALEEAAAWLDNYDDFHAESYASLVRALKDKPNG
jgi:hypothetical protein